MTNELSKISMMGRRAIETQDWPGVDACASEIIRRDPESAEGYFLAGKVERAKNRPKKAIEAFERALKLESIRYDAAVELANQYSIARRNGDALKLLTQYEDKLDNSPIYLTLAGTVYTEIGMSRKAWPLFKKATELQPGVDLFQANLATCAVFLGKIEKARTTYQSLLQRFPSHRKNHYHLSRLQRARDYSHLDQMKQILAQSDEPPSRQIYLYFAIAKELEDLEQWGESFEFYKKAGDAVNSVARYNISNDIALIDKIIEVCTPEWLAQGGNDSGSNSDGKTPIFIVGLPRTGTTLTERIISSHSQVESLGETLFLQMVLRQESGIKSVENMNPQMIESLAEKDMGLVAKAYLEAVSYRLGQEPMFIDKLPFNFLYMGFIARAWPDARIVHLVRNPMDSCFSMYKQLFTWAYLFSYSLDDLAQYFVAHDRLRNHWKNVLQDRMIEVEYESLVTDQERQTRRLLDQLGLEYEPACLDFDQNKAPSATASSVQVRGKVHSGSINKWKRFADQLQPLKDHLERSGIQVD